MRATPRGYAHIWLRHTPVMDTSTRLQQNIHFIHLFATSHPKQTKALADTISRGQLLTVCEIVLNIKVGNIEKPKLFAKHIDFLETLSDSSVTVDFKRDILSTSAIYRGVVKKLLSHFITCVKNI